MPQRKHLRRLSIQSFLSQTYGRRELLVAAEAGDEIQEHPLIRRVDKPQRRMTLGDLRNWMCEMAAGDWIAHWDDDDWYPADRLERSMRAALEAGASAYGCRSAWFDDGADAWMYRGGQAWHVCGTTLVYARSAWEALRFTADHVGEDVQFALRLHRNGMLFSDGEQVMAVARDHGANTSPRPRHGSQWQRFARTSLPAEYLAALEA